MPTTSKRTPAKKTAAPPPEEDNGVGPAEDMPNLSRRGKTIRDALTSAGLPVLPDASDDVWAMLAAPFEPDEIERLPKQVSRDDNEKGRCEPGTRFSADGHHCGGWHARSVHLEYVGHAGITTRLNDVVGPAGWDYEPYATSADGLPLIGGQWFAARLTILNVSKWDLAYNYSSPQEAYGDALRRCAMRFGIGTYLWSKSEKARAVLDPPPPPPANIDNLLARLDHAAREQGTDREGITAKWREQQGGVPVDALPLLAPMTLAPLVESIEAWIEAQKAQATQAGE